PDAARPAAAGAPGAAGPPAEISTAPRCHGAPNWRALRLLPPACRVRAPSYKVPGSSPPDSAARRPWPQQRKSRAGTSTPPKRNTAGPIISSGILASSPSFATSSLFIPSHPAAVPALRHALHKVRLRCPLAVCYFFGLRSTPSPSPSPSPSRQNSAACHRHCPRPRCIAGTRRSHSLTLFAH
ncbi:hypothetical protein SVAN01_03143, partial [Stagonosporopsis vannaccii]